MLAKGYPYAIIGEAGPVDFCVKTVSAIVIAGSDMGTVRRALRDSEPKP
jgi:hypothetical protein